MGIGKKWENDKFVKGFAEKLIRNYKIERLIFFGSRVKGDALKNSDYDFIVVSPDFEGIFFTNRMSLLLEFWDAPYDFEALCYTPDEFKKKSKQIGIVRKALKEGIKIK